MSVAVVLGAGGLTGQAFHAGVLAGLAEAGFDARDARVVVGTSAGAAAGAYLRLGLSPADFAALLTHRELTDAGRALVDRLGPSDDWTEPTRARTWSPPHPNLVGRLVRSPWRVRPEALLGCAIPTGRLDTAAWTAALRPVAGAAWPADPLWICAVRMDDTRRVVFGRPDAPRTDVPTAIGASCAIPGYFAPVTIHGRRYVDGAVHSPTNADVLRRDPPDLVVVSSPMSMSGSVRRHPRRAARTHFRARLGQELRRLTRAGTRATLVFQPSEEDLAIMGGRSMDPERIAHVVEQTLATTRRRLAARPGSRELLAATC